MRLVEVQLRNYKHDHYRFYIVFIIDISYGVSPYNSYRGEIRRINSDEWIVKCDFNKGIMDYDKKITLTFDSLEAAKAYVIGNAKIVAATW